MTRLAKFIAGHSAGFLLGCTYGAVLAAGGQALVSLAKAVM
jgi:hypothetical protein